MHHSQPSAASSLPNNISNTDQIQSNRPLGWKPRDGRRLLDYLHVPWDFATPTTGFAHSARHREGVW